MNTLPVVFIGLQLLLAVQTLTDCPKECECRPAEFGGTVAHCSSLNAKQIFPNDVQHLNITDASPDTPFFLESKIFKQLHLDQLLSVKIVNSSLLLIAADAFYGMEMLNYVDLSNNQLTSIPPDTFKNNSKLLQVSLSGNPLELNPLYLPQQNYFLKSDQITDLSLSFCELRKIDRDVFSQLPKLENLNLEGNKIHFLAKNVFNDIPFLEEINLSNNQITDLNADLFAPFEDLTTLKLANNSIYNFDDVDIPSLKELDLSFNDFTSLESSTLEGVQDVTQVSFSHNKIETIDMDTFAELNMLRYVDLSYNNLKGPLSQFLFETNTELETLSLAHNKDIVIFNGFFGNLKHLYKLEISYCGLRELSEESLNNFQDLSTLDLSGNELTELLPNTFQKLKHLNNLDLSNNQLKSLPENLFQGNMDLRRLWIAGNRIHHLPARLFKPVPHLTLLDASRCRFNYLWNLNESAYMKENKILGQLTSLNLAGNKFQTLHQHNFESFGNLNTLDISNNPFQCDQFFILLMQWLHQEKVTPAKYLGKSSYDLQQEHAELHWNHMLSKVCSDHNIINGREQIKPVKKPEATKRPDSEYRLLNDEIEPGLFSWQSTNTLNTPKTTQRKEKVENPFADGPWDSNDSDSPITDTRYPSFSDLVAEKALKGDSSEEDTEYPWLWPLMLVLICGIAILLAIFNLSALILYRTGRNYRVAGYRSTFISPVSAHIKMKRDAGSFYHKLYEECSVPNTVPIITGTDDLKKSSKMSTIITSGATKGEDMV